MSNIKNSYKCSLELTMDLIGGKWKLMILWHLIDGPKRFGELKRNLPSITQRILTLQLRTLEETGIISRKIYASVPPKVEYSMTNYGKDLIPILNHLCNWSTKYANNNDINLGK